MANEILKGDVLFHSAHGLCRVSAVASAKEPDGCRYTLQPVTNSNGSISFMIPESALENSGFKKLITDADGKAILNFFRTGSGKKPSQDPAWQSAKLIRDESLNRDAVKDIKRRQQLHRAVKGLVSELAFVLNMTAKDVATRIQKDLSQVDNINPSVLTAFTKLDRE